MAGSKNFISAVQSSVSPGYIYMWATRERATEKFCTSAAEFLLPLKSIRRVVVPRYRTCPFD